MSTDTLYRNEIDTTIELTRMACGACGVQFAMPTVLEREHSKLGAKSSGWYCPNGHCRVYRESKADRLERELSNARSSLADVRADLAKTEAQRRAQKAVATKLKKRALAGVCAFCKRTFKDYARHMESKHSEER